jgi:hypothetical protein
VVLVLPVLCAAICYLLFGIWASLGVLPLPLPSATSATHCLPCTIMCHVPLPLPLLPLAAAAGCWLLAAGCPGCWCAAALRSALCALCSVFMLHGDNRFH